MAKKKATTSKKTTTAKKTATKTTAPAMSDCDNCNCLEAKCGCECCK